MQRPTSAFLVMLGALLSGCQAARPPITTMDKVDLPRFMGDWYVIANIPTFMEKGAHNAIESYKLETDGTISTTFTFNKGAFDGPKKEMHPRGFVADKDSNAIWGMRFVWPIKADYRIVYVNDEYTHTIVGRQARDYVWIMARTPRISDKDYDSLKERVAREGYDVARLQKVPHEVRR